MQRDLTYLVDMLISARDACRFAEGISFEQLQASDLHQHAIVKAIELVGEAAARVSVEARTQHPEIPWTQIIGMRNRLVHAYASLDPVVLWEVVHEHLPPLIARLQALVPPGDGPDVS